MRVLSAFTLLHLLTDLCSASLYVLASTELWQVVLYNFVAFVLQLPIGWLLDAFPCSLRMLLVGSAGLMGLGVAEYALLCDPVVAIALACLGNAIFHVAAGKHLLDQNQGRATEVSIYISTGAIGLLAGLRFGSMITCPCLLGVLVLFLLIAASVWNLTMAPLGNGTRIPLLRRVGPLETIAVACLMAIVTWRSYGVLISTCEFNSSYTSCLFLALLTVSSVAGQAMSGILSDRFGRYLVLSISMIGSVALFLVRPEDSALGCVALMFVAQLATGPVMTFLFEFCHGRGGLAFGLNCVALFVSTLFMYCPAAMMFYLAGDWLTMALEFAATAWVRLPRWFLAIVAVNVLTHPALTYAVSSIGGTMPVVVLGEIAVVIVEGLVLSILYRRHASWWKMFGIALWMNSVSYFTGVCLYGPGW